MKWLKFELNFQNWTDERTNAHKQKKMALTNFIITNKPVESMSELYFRLFASEFLNNMYSNVVMLVMAGMEMMLMITMDIPPYVTLPKMEQQQKNTKNIPSDGIKSRIKLMELIVSGHHNHPSIWTCEIK